MRRVMQGTILRSHVFQILAKETLFLDEQVRSRSSTDQPDHPF